MASRQGARRRGAGPSGRGRAVAGGAMSALTTPSLFRLRRTPEASMLDNPPARLQPARPIHSSDFAYAFPL